MTIVNKGQLQSMLEDKPNGGVIFCQYLDGCIDYDVHISDGTFGATTLIPENGEIIDYDWSINEYEDDDKFAVFSPTDIMKMIQLLVKGLDIPLTFRDISDRR